MIIPSTLWNKSMQNNNNNKTKQKEKNPKQNNKQQNEEKKKKTQYILILTKWYTGGLSVLEVKNIMIANITHTGKNSCHR